MVHPVSENYGATQPRRCNLLPCAAQTAGESSLIVLSQGWNLGFRARAQELSGIDDAKIVRTTCGRVVTAPLCHDNVWRALLDPVRSDA